MTVKALRKSVIIYEYIMSKYDYIFILEKFDTSIKFISKEINLFYKYKGTMYTTKV